jgi:small subunit ribosomal protein S1
VQAKVLKIDGEHRRLSLGLKQLNDIWANWFEAHKLNEIVRGKVARNTSFGAFVELAEGVEGLCHVSEIEERRAKGESADRAKSKSQAAKPALSEGAEYDFKVIRLDPAQRKISLSYRAAKKQAERQEIAAFRSSKSSPTATIGDAILAKRQAN